MSLVSGVTLQIGISCGNGESIDRVNAWLSERQFGPLGRVTRASFGGSKHPLVEVYGGGFNYFPEDDFANFVASLPWLGPETVVLLINSEEGATRVFRPPH